VPFISPEGSERHASRVSHEVGTPACLRSNPREPGREHARRSAERSQRLGVASGRTMHL